MAQDEPSPRLKSLVIMLARRSIEEAESKGVAPDKRLDHALRFMIASYKVIEKTGDVAATDAVGAVVAEMMTVTGYCVIEALAAMDDA